MTPLSEKLGVPLCENCGQRPGNMTWLGEGGALALVHGHGRAWCEQCILDAQIDFAEKAASRLQSLRARREALA